jgi:hypothetical protein
VVLHDVSEAHLDRFVASGAVVLNLPLRRSESFTPGLARIADPDLIARAAEKDRTEAISPLLATVKRQESKSVGWPDELASAMMQNPSQILSRWGIRTGLAARTLDSSGRSASHRRHSERGSVHGRHGGLSRPQWNRWQGSTQICDFPTSPT